MTVHCETRRIASGRFGRGVVWCAIALALAGAGCAHRAVIRQPAPPSSARLTLARADALVRDGCYTCLGEAADLYGRVADGLEAGAAPGDVNDAARKRVDTRLVMALRERELGLGAGASLEQAQAAAGALPAPWSFDVFRGVVAASTWRTNGVSREQQDTIFTTTAETGRSWLAWRQALLPADPARDPWAAYHLLALDCSQTYRLREAKLSPWNVPAAAPPLLRFRRATCTSYDRGLLEQVLAEVPAFGEAHLFLGELALAAGTLRTAERHFAAALDALPALQAARLSLGHVYFAMEDLDLALGTYHAVAAAVPGQREALFGEAKALSYLGRHDEAIGVLDRMVALGTWYQGEAHYWRAWNRFRLQHYDAADADAAGARSRLPMDVPLGKLMGQIALARHETGRAEREFATALEHMVGKGERDCDVWYLYGSVLVLRKAWREAAPHFASAVPCYADAETAARRRIGEIRASDLPEDRKARLIAAKERAIAGVHDQAGRAAFNGAAAFFNAGQPDTAKPLAERAASHPDVGEQARALLARIK